MHYYVHGDDLCFLLYYDLTSYTDRTRKRNQGEEKTPRSGSPDMTLPRLSNEPITTQKNRSYSKESSEGKGQHKQREVNGSNTAESSGKIIDCVYISFAVLCAILFRYFYNNYTVKVGYK